MEKFNINKADQLKALISKIVNKQLAKYNLTVDSPEIKNSKDWYSKYTFDTHEEYLNWKKYCIELLTKNIAPKLNKKRAEREFQWINLQYGLRQNYNTRVVNKDGSIEFLS